ncbi:MAG: hypothetical protein ACRCSQ_08170, partial [Bacteroidales bacterium]
MSQIVLSRWIFTIVYGLLLILATFPDISNGDFAFLKLNHLEGYLFPVGMIVALYLFEACYQLYTLEIPKRKLVQGMLGTFLARAFLIIALILSIYIECYFMKVGFFFLSWILVTALKWVNIRMTEQETEQLLKP